MISIILEVRSQIMITETKAKSEIREPDEWDAMLRVAGLHADGEPVYRLTTKGRRAAVIALSAKNANRSSARAANAPFEQGAVGDLR
jgi:hypothetical protein